MTTEINLDTGKLREESAHVALDGDRGVRVQPLDITIGSQLGASFEGLRLEALQRLATSRGVELRELTDDDRKKPPVRFSEELRKQVVTALADVLDTWDEGFVTDGAGNNIDIDAQIGGDGKRKAARTLVIEHWSRKRTVWCMKMISTATELSAELEGNSPAGADGIGDTGPAAPRLIETSAVAVKAGDDDDGAPALSDAAPDQPTEASGQN